MLLKGRFLVEALLGSGGMGEVVLAKDQVLKRKVAIKALHWESENHEEKRKRFLREAQSISQLDHPNICTIFEVFEEDGRDFIVMQYVDGLNLKQLQETKALQLKKIMTIVEQVCKGMAAAHQHQIVHRDLKPANIMVDRQGLVKILDFGLAKWGGEEVTATETAFETKQGVIMGTVPYMSPEQLMGKAIDPRSDQFSFGIMLHELFTGAHPFPGEAVFQTMYRISSVEPQWHPALPSSLKSVLSQMLAKDPKDRFVDFASLWEALALAIGQLRDDRLADLSSLEESRMETLSSLAALRSSSGGGSLGGLVQAYRTKSKSGEGRPEKGQRVPWPLKILGAFSLVLLLGWMLVFHGRDLWQMWAGPQAQRPIVLVSPVTGEPTMALEAVSFLITEALRDLEGADILTDTQWKGMNRSLIAENPPQGLVFPRPTHELSGMVSMDANVVLSPLLVDLLTGEKRHNSIPGPDEQALYEEVEELRRWLKTTLHLPEDGVPLDRVFGETWADFLMFYRGVEAYQRFDFYQARLAFEQALTVPWSRLFLVELLTFTGETQTARSLLHPLLQEGQKGSLAFDCSVEALNARLRFDFEGERQALALRLDRYPYDKNASYAMAELYFSRGRAQEALAWYERTLALDGRFNKAINHMGYCVSYLGRHQEALERFREYTALDEEVANAWDSLGDGYFFSGDYNSALRYKQAALRKDEASVDWAYLTIADSCILLGDQDGLTQALDRYVALAGTEDKPRRLAIQKMKEAVFVFVSGHETQALALAQESLGLYDEAILGEGADEVHWFLGWLLLQQGRLEEARSHLDWLAKMCDHYRLNEGNFAAPYKFFLHLQAESAAAQGAWTEALGYYQQLEALAPNLSYWITMFHYPFFSLRHALFLDRKGQRQRAWDVLKKCLAFSSHYPPALLVADQWSKEQGLENQYHKQLEHLANWQSGSMVVPTY
jgi:serine/threonine protein kinase/tetratricopeptide (TPR) repeat protein